MLWCKQSIEHQCSYGKRCQCLAVSALMPSSPCTANTRNALAQNTIREDGTIVGHWQRKGESDHLRVLIGLALPRLGESLNLLAGPNGDMTAAGVQKFLSWVEVKPWSPIT